MINVRIQNLTKRFGGLAALDGVDFAIEPGELFFLLGPSGCGKTTLLRCIAGFYAPDKGSILFGGEDVTRVPAHRRNTGMVFQNYALWPHMTVAQNVAFGLKERRVPRPEREKRVREALAWVQMDEYLDRRPNQLSGGQQQRVALARALVVKPRCLLLDEPLSNLDAKLRLETRDHIRSLCKQAGITAIYVTHDQKEALAIADRLAVFDRGRIRQIGAPNEVYRRPVDRFVAGFIGESNFLDGEVRIAAEGEATIATPLGLLRSKPCERSVKVGERVAVCLRPEALRLADGQATDESRPPEVNAFQARIVHSVYLGELAQHKIVAGVSVADGRAANDPQRRLSCELKVFEMNPQRMAIEGESLPVVCRVDPTDVIVVAPT